jgi:hypothetical protein
VLAQELRVTAPLIAAVVAPAGVLQAAGSGGLKASSPLAESPANLFVVMMNVVGSPAGGLTAVSVMLATTLPDKLTAASFRWEADIPES